jgi:hypothetical protein
VSLIEALRHGRARYKDESVPWRVRDGAPQVGIPIAKSDGEPGTELAWEDVSEEIARTRWYQAGWILE